MLVLGANLRVNFLGVWFCLVSVGRSVFVRFGEAYIVNKAFRWMPCGS